MASEVQVAAAQGGLPGCRLSTPREDPPPLAGSASCISHTWRLPLQCLYGIVASSRASQCCCLAWHSTSVSTLKWTSAAADTNWHLPCCNIQSTECTSNITKDIHRFRVNIKRQCFVHHASLSELLQASIFILLANTTILGSCNYMSPPRLACSDQACTILKEHPENIAPG